MSIKTKFLLWFNITSVVIIGIFSLVMYLGVIHSMEEGINNRLMSVAEATSYIIREPQRGVPLACGSHEFGDILEAFIGYSGSEGYVRIVDKENKIASCTSSSSTMLSELSPVDHDSLRAFKSFFKDVSNPDGRDKKVRILFFPITYDNVYGGFIEVGSSLARLESMKVSLLNIFLMIIPVTLFIANLGGIVIFNRGLMPIIFLSRETKALGARELSKRLPLPSSRDEIYDLFVSVNEMIARLEKAFEQTRQFSGDASHELRTPLTIMKGEIEVALRSERTVEEYQDILVSILEEIERMTNIVEDLLLISKSEAGEIIIEKSELNLKELLDGLCEQLAMFGEDRHVRLIYDNIDHIVIAGDRLRLRQVFTNIIVNAIKYNRDGGTVDVSAHPFGGGIVVKINDTGIGIRKEDLPRIFDRFYRADKSRKRDIGGAGLGLSICKWIIEGHGGYIQVESEFGAGSTFTVWLPLK